jgi:hypothetical protein
MSSFASPLNPDTAYLTLQISGVTSAPGCSSQNPGQTGLIHGGIDAAPAAGTYCQLQLVTTNGGVSWQPLQLPTAGTLGVLSANAGSLAVEGSLRAQGSLLYGVVTDWGIGLSGVTPPGRLVVSSDGAHWTLCDGSLFTQGYVVRDFAATATPAGSELIVIAEPVNDPSAQAPTYSPTLSVWSSADEGLTWTEGGPTPDSGTRPGQSGYMMSMSAGVIGGQPAVYTIVGDKGSTTQLFASLDGGRTWQASGPLNPGGAALADPELLGTLADGAVIIAQILGSEPTLAWKPGTAPRQIARNANLQQFSSPIIQQRSDGVYLWLTGYNSADSRQVVEYTRLQL